MATVRANPSFNAQKTAEEFSQALKGFFSADEKGLTKLLVGINNAQRQQVVAAYKTMFGKDLVADLKKMLGGTFEDLVVALMEPPAVHDAITLRNAMKGAGTDEETIIEVLTTRPNAHILAIRQAYTAIFSRDLEKDLVSETSGSFKHICVSLVQGSRNETTKTDLVSAARDAQALHGAGEGSWFTDASEFNRVFITNNKLQLKLIADEYQKISKITLADAVKKELKGPMENAVLALLNSSLNVHEFFAERLYRSMHGVGTDDAALIRGVVTRCEVDMLGIKAAFLAKYGKTLAHAIKGDCSGTYRYLLDALIGEAD